ncbi:sugar ABC transporter substrate-binding protein [Breoghania sp. L-A4]|uniref:sugar ABC transporter substrate-binding protein n=1 Tax=Breoghania sp. L-A4 TaxID=2304600 RepID=UPI000E3608DC|nr:sugar ABC transporter substrate-binding protein [Breoghania sp. L-A4]AXS42249.1 hypothetical protein D1F64_22485 [Breoghania sp. L-A4]
MWVISGAAHAEGRTIAVFTRNLINPAYAAARRGADLIAEEKGATTRHHVPEKPDNVDQQKALVAEALAAKPDLVIFVPVDDKAMVEFSAFKIACTAARAGLRHLDGEEVPDDITVPSVLIDKSNLGPWKVPLNECACPGWEEIVH